MTHVDDIDDATATANGELTHTAIWRHKFHTHAFLCVCVLLRRASNGVWGLAHSGATNKREQQQQRECRRGQRGHTAMTATMPARLSPSNAYPLLLLLRANRNARTRARSRKSADISVAVHGDRTDYNISYCSYIDDTAFLLHGVDTQCTNATASSIPRGDCLFLYIKFAVARMHKQTERALPQPNTAKPLHVLSGCFFFFCWCVSACVCLRACVLACAPDNGRTTWRTVNSGIAADMDFEQS